MKLLKTNLAITSIIPVIDNHTDFNFIRNYLLNRPTITEQQITSSIAKTIDPNGKETLYDSSVQAQLGKNSKWPNKPIIHCTREQRLESSKNDIHKLWDHIFTDTPVINIKLIVGNRKSPNATKIFDTKTSSIQIITSNNS